MPQQQQQQQQADARDNQLSEDAAAHRQISGTSRVKVVLVGRLGARFRVYCHCADQRHCRRRRSVTPIAATTAAAGCTGRVADY